MTQHDPAKRRVAEAAAALVESGMAVGLGSGTTAAEMVIALGKRVSDEGLRIVAVPTSVATAELANSLRIPLRELDDVDSLDLSLDGADEVDPCFRLLKGHGGALLREKIVASSARKRVTMITPEKRVESLGTKMPIPVEASAIGLRHTERRLQALGASTSIRKQADGADYLTDGGNGIIDCRFPSVVDPEELNCRLQCVVGVFDHGLFLGLCDVLVVGYPDRVEWIEKSEPRK